MRLFACPCGMGVTRPAHLPEPPTCPGCGKVMAPPGPDSLRVERLPADCLPPGVKIADEDILDVAPGRCPHCGGPEPCTRYACVEVQAANMRAAGLPVTEAGLRALLDLRTDNARTFAKITQAAAMSPSAEEWGSDAARQHEQALLDAAALAALPGIVHWHGNPAGMAGEIAREAEAVASAWVAERRKRP